ncbi:MAG: MMPL family transporter [Caldithrix sp.]|nr:MMPL family transporter [Caldithrix sp.]
MTLSGFSLNNRYTVYALTIGAVIFGLMAYASLPIQLFPDTAPPLVNIITAYPGAAAEDVADLVSDPIETECAALEGVHEVSSTSQDGLSLVTVEFKYGRDVDLAAVDAQNAISRIRGKLPDKIGEPQVIKFSTSDRPVLTMGLSGENMVEIRRLAEEVFSPALQRVDGVAVVDVFGGYEPEISIQVNRQKMEAYRLSLAQIVQAVKEQNISVPAGQIRSEGQQYTFRLDAQSTDIEDIMNILVDTPAGARVRISHFADVQSGASEDLSRFRVNGQSAIAMQIFKQDDANTVDVVRLSRAKFEDLDRQYPSIDFLEAEESASFTEQVVDNMLGSVWQALVLAAVIIFLFLASFKRGFVVAISMPLSFLLTFAGMKLFAIEVNMVTLTAIILSVGMVVDGSVVVLENITRHYSEQNMSPLQAAKEGANEIQFAVIAGNATTLTVLIPLLFMYGFVGKTFGPLAGTLIIAFVSSMIVALTLVPILTMHVSGNDGRFDKWAHTIAGPWRWLMDKTRTAYLTILRHSLRHGWMVFITAAGLLIIGLLILRFQGMELLPKMDSGASFVTVETPSGSSLDETENVMREVEQILLAEPQVEKISNQMGFEPGMHSFGGGGVQGPTQGYISVTLTPRTERSESIWQIQNRLRDKMKRIPNIQNLVVRESGSTARATTAASIVVSIKGGDALVLDQLGQNVLNRIKTIDGIVNPYRSWRRDQRTIRLTIDEKRMRELGLSAAQVSAQMIQALDGINAGVLKDNLGVDTPIRVRYNEQFRNFREDAFEIRTIAPADGQMIPMGAILREQDVYVQGLVTRQNLQPTLDVLALHADRPLNFVTADVANMVKKIETPQGYELSLEGENKDMEESRGELMSALFIAFIAIYLLLAAQFRSFLHPITVMMSVPLSIIGIALALWIAGKPVSMPVLVGMILLLGIVVNNSIILIDFIRQRRQAGEDRRSAIINSVGTRFRPIMMTSLSTIVGMIPLAAEWALGAERFSPLAVAVIGGMVASSFLTMIVIPVLYDAFEGAKVKLGKITS